MNIYIKAQRFCQFDDELVRLFEIRFKPFVDNFLHQLTKAIKHLLLKCIPENNKRRKRRKVRLTGV